MWPANSVQPQYKLDGASARQGFYFYRNDRLIQAGGWNGWRETQEPHLSLARIRVNLPTTQDSHFSLDVKKCGINTPPMFPIALQSAVFADGTRFEDYLRTAEAVYRKRLAVTNSDYPLVPAQGLPRKVQKVVQRRLLPDGGKSRDLAICWKRMDSDVFFEIDRENETLFLNSRYRRVVLRGSSGSKNDAPLIKSLLFFLLADDFESQRITKKKKERLETMNAVLVSAVQCLDD